MNRILIFALCFVINFVIVNEYAIGAELAPLTEDNPDFVAFLKARNTRLVRNPTENLDEYALSKNRTTVTLTRAAGAEEIRFRLSDNQAAHSDTIYRTLYQGLNRDYIAEHSKRSLWYCTKHVFGDGLLSRFSNASTFVTLSALFFPKVVETASVPFKKAGVKIDAGSLDDYLAASIVLSTLTGFTGAVSDVIKIGVATPHLFHLSTERFREELRILSILASLRLGEDPLEERVMDITNNIFDCIKLTPTQKSLPKHIAHTLYSATKRGWTKCTRRGFGHFAALEEDHPAADAEGRFDLRERGAQYITQLSKLYKNTPSYNLMFSGNYDIVMPVLGEI